MMDIMTGIAAAGQALDAVKKLRDLEKDFDAASFRMEIANLMMALSDAKIALVEAQQTIQDRDAEIRRLNDVQAARRPIVYFQGFNFGIGPDGQSMGFPFCPVCEKQGHQHQMVEVLGHFRCPVCKMITDNMPTMLPLELLPSGH